MSPGLHWVYFGDEYKIWAIHKTPGTKRSNPPQETLSPKQKKLPNEDVYTSCHGIPYLYEPRGSSAGGPVMHFSPCGRYLLISCDSDVEGSESKSSVIAAWTEPAYLDNGPSGEAYRWQSVDITGPPELESEDAKIHVDFVAGGRPLCVLTYWIRSKSDDLTEISDIYCVLLDVEKGTSTKIAQTTLTLAGYPGWCFKSTDSHAAFGGSLARSWHAFMSQMERSAHLSHCGGYIVLAASLKGCHWQRVLDLAVDQHDPLVQDLSSQATTRGDTFRVIGPSRSYWRDHCYWASIQHQRVLLHRATRGTGDDDRDQFSHLGVFHELAVIPASIADGIAWVILPELDNQPTKIVIGAAGESPEVMHLDESWADFTAILDSLEHEHGNRMLNSVYG